MSYTVSNSGMLALVSMCFFFFFMGKGHLGAIEMVIMSVIIIHIFDFSLRICMLKHNNPVTVTEALLLGDRDCWCYSKALCQHINLTDSLATTAVPRHIRIAYSICLLGL